MAEITRRLLLKLAGCGGVSAMAAGMGIKNAQRLIPLVIPPTEDFHPGRWMHYATTCRECPAGCGMHARCVDGRVQKSEGNPEHPLSRGGLCPRGQSAVQGLYDPDRIDGAIRRTPGQRAHAASIEEAVADISQRLRKDGARLAIISDLQTGTLAELMKQLAGSFGSDRLLFYEAFDYEPLRRAHQMLFGQALVPHYRLEQSPFIISFGADFLETWVSPVEFARAFADRHSTPQATDAHFVYAGPRLSMTAGNADKFFHVTPPQMLSLAAKMLDRMIQQRLAKNDISAAGELVKAWIARGGEPPLADEAVDSLVKMFVEASGSVALAGPTGSRGPLALELALAAGLLNFAAGRIGQTVDFSRPHALSAVADDEQIGKFLDGLSKDDVLIVHNANIAFSHPRGGDIRKAGTVVYLGTLDVETAQVADWTIAIDSPLESWGDYEPYSGLHCLIQPAMRRLRKSCPAGDVMLAIAQEAGKEVSPSGGRPASDFESFLEQRWRQIHREVAPQEAFEDFWTNSLRRGFVAQEPPAQTAQPKLDSDALRQAAATAASMPAGPADQRHPGTMDLWLWASIMFFDGRTANRGWIQEAPDPTSAVVWGSWLDMHPDDAGAMELKDGDVVRLRNGDGGSVELPVRRIDDVLRGTVAMCFGQGHWAMGEVARRGANAFALSQRPGEGLFAKVSIENLHKQDLFVSLSATQLQFNRELLRWTSAQEASGTEGTAPSSEHYALPLPEGYNKSTDLYPPLPYKKYRWAMVIDLERCTGCGACAVACYAENNIPIMGKGQCFAGREMAWLKVTPYRRQENPKQMGWMVLPCQQCDDAPCEPVCPVFAAVHNEEGINSQVYNRCIGTRYCNNNCPYKVRRFNWINIDWKQSIQWQLNPEVTVRSRGVMEKCSFCIQRIKQAQHASKRYGKPIKDGQIQPACAQSCPTRAIMFGNLLDQNSEVGRATRGDPRRYHLLADLNTKPAVAYLKRINKEVPRLGEF